MISKEKRIGWTYQEEKVAIGAYLYMKNKNLTRGDQTKISFDLINLGLIDRSSSAVSLKLSSIRKIESKLEEQFRTGTQEDLWLDHTSTKTKILCEIVFKGGFSVPEGLTLIESVEWLSVFWDDAHAQYKKAS